MSQTTCEGPSTSTRSQGKTESTGKKGGQRGQEKTEKMPDFKQMIADALTPIRDDLTKIPSRETVDAMLADFLAKIEEKIEAKVQERVNELISRVDALEQKVESMESAMVVLEHFHKKTDENEQYSRPACLRNFPLPKKGRKEDREKKLKQIMKDMNCGLNPNDIDRAHRIRSKRTDDDGVVSQQIIVKFKSFWRRTLFYRNRAKAKNDTKVRLDLTKRRLSSSMMQKN
eukprot:Seg971.8 transcript_id=Seg971.8/GoldUCD/mRNA.D3Y31 product="hypothetical protein" protein_id=Seg971.8/GoldUCD/D3Y31